MNDLQKMINLVLEENMVGDKWRRNLLLKNVMEYLYDIWSCLVKDNEKGKILVEREQKELIEEINSPTVNIMKDEAKKKIVGKEWHICEVIKIMKARVLFENEIIRDYINSSSFYKRHKIKKYNLKMFHQKICNDMFKNIGGSYGKSQYIWVAMELDDEESDEFRENNDFRVEDNINIKFEIMSTDILAYDGYVFEKLRGDTNSVGEFIREIYSPYLVEFYIDSRELGDKQSDFLRQMYQEKGWYKAKITDLTTEIDTDTDIVFEGAFIHSASPVQYENKKLVICDKKVDNDALNKIENTYNMNDVKCTSDSDIQGELKELFDGVKFQKNRVYNVGNGNCIYNYGIKGNGYKNFYFDIGFDMHVHFNSKQKTIGDKYKAALNNIKNSKPHCVILSHWDEDHFRGCVCSNKKIYDIRWIGPNIKKSERKGNAKRLFLYLYLIGSLKVVERGIAREIVINHEIKSCITLYVGNRKRGTDRKITNCNCQGIAMCIENNTVHSEKIRCMMQGDVPYMSLPPKANFGVENPYEYLVVPHHGAEMDCSLLKATTKKNGYAVICCSGDTSVNRPEKGHWDELKNCYNDVIFTDKATGYIELNLQKKNDIRLN